MKAYKDLSEAELIILLKEDDHAAFTEILNRYSPILINFAYRRVQDVDLARDLAQDVFAMLWEKRSIFIVNQGVESYIFIAARNKIIDYSRKQKVTQKYLDDFTTFYSMEENKTDYLVRHRHLAAMIEQEIAALPEQMRQVFELSRNKDMKRKEIAELLNMPENSVKTNMQRGLKILKRRFGSSFSIFFIFF